MPTDIFEECDDYEEIITYFGDYGEDPFYRFCRKFYPDTEEWDEFTGEYENVYGCFVEESVDDEDCDYDEEDYDDVDLEDDDEDDEDSEDEDVNAWDTEPQYPLDEIDSLEISGSTFVLTGDFQNCDGDRNQVKEMIEAKGGRCTGAVSGKTNYLG